MDKNMVRAFNTAYGKEPTAAQKQAAEDVLSVWAKLDGSVSKKLAIHRRALLLGMCLQDAINRGEIVPRPVKGKRPEQEPTGAVKNEPPQK